MSETKRMASSYLSYDSCTKTYHVAPGASASGIVAIQKAAPHGVTLLVRAGLWASGRMVRFIAKTTEE